MASWEQLGELSTVAQLTGLDAVRLIGLIVQAATTARMHRKNCRQFAQHLKLIGNLLEQLKISELKKYPETREPLEQLEDALRRSYVLVDSCQNRSYLYLLAMGWNIVYQFKRAQNEIDRYLRIVPLITLVDNARVRERIDSIERDEREYTLDEEDRKVQDAIFDRDPSTNHATVLKKSLSCSYPNVPFDEALKKEREKLQMELQRSYDVGQSEMIQHLIGVTQNVASAIEERSTQLKSPNKVELNCADENSYKEKTFGKNGHEQDTKATFRTTSSDSLGHDMSLHREHHIHEEWHSDLLGCCSEPSLCMKTFFYPCGTFSQIATVAKNRPVTSAEACNDLMAYSLILSCCCYTCCVRRKLRKMFDITGGLCDDFLSHLLCCCCALVQEWREVEIRGGVKEHWKTKTSPPASQYMEA
ncbi:PLAC8 family [Musa troglodytarum]|uniref:PLAC8 family n=1 Tax=Musa troglodytarum TaxID=320322 RepID=A0A9E7GSE9_9LILI|nr:PLAC8 family [Musa troglodytarum]